jgi:PUA-domain protein
LTDLRLRKRHRLRLKEIASIARGIDDALGTKSFTEQDVVDMAEGPDYDVVFVNGKILAFMPDGVPFLTVRGLLKYTSTKRFVTVDMGAIKFVYNGADVMGPGIVETDPGIKEGDLVWVRDVNNLRPLAVGRALMDSAAMKRKERGKAVGSMLHVGDKLWQVDEPKPESEDDEEESPEV